MQSDTLRGGVCHHGHLTVMARSPRQNSKEEEEEEEEEVRSEVFILCSVVTVTFRTLLLFVVMKCYSYSKIESVIIKCSCDR